MGTPLSLTPVALHRIRQALWRRGASYWLYDPLTESLFDERTGELLDDVLTPAERQVYFRYFFRNPPGLARKGWIP